MGALTPAFFSPLFSVQWALTPSRSHFAICISVCLSFCLPVVNKTPGHFLAILSVCQNLPQVNILFNAFSFVSFIDSPLSPSPLFTPKRESSFISLIPHFPNLFPQMSPQLQKGGLEGCEWRAGFGGMEDSSRAVSLSVETNDITVTIDVWNKPANTRRSDSYGLYVCLFFCFTLCVCVCVFVCGNNVWFLCACFCACEELPNKLCCSCVCV